ncbi:MAG: acyl carrier protein [Azospirillaceae bacterium]
MTDTAPAPLADTVAGLVASVLGLAPDAVDAATRAADLDAWDSLGHVRIILALESRYGVAFSMEEIAAADSVARLADLVERARAA